MYIIKLFDGAITPKTIIADRKSKSISDAEHRALSVASQFDIPGYDAIHKIEIYADDALVDTIVC